MSAPTPPGPPVTFRPLSSGSQKVECSVCGQRGYEMPASYARSWTNAHRRGHLPCRKGCGKLLSVLANGRARSHPRCPS